MPSKPKRTRLEKLQNSWTKASVEERVRFLVWLRQQDDQAGGAGTGLGDLSGFAPIASGRYLLPSAISRIRARMAERGLSAADLMAEIGFERDDPSLARALEGNASLRLAVVAALEGWLISTRSPVDD